MNIEEFRELCLSLPHATEDVKWEKDLCFCVGGKMFAVVGLEPGKTIGSFKCSPENFAELTEREGIVPAPYLARHHWVGLKSFAAIDDDDYNDLMKEAHRLVYEKLPKTVREELSEGDG